MKYLFTFLLSFLIFQCTVGQATNPQEPTVIFLDDIESNVKREEVQRYFGYETLLPRYLTIPYDISVNVNQQGRFVDIGYLFIALIPLGLMAIFFRRKKIFYSLAIFFLLYLGMSLHYSFIVLDNLRQVWYEPTQWGALGANDLNSFNLKLLKASYDGLTMIASPVVALFERISAQKDHITYPTLFFLLLGTQILLLRFIKMRVETKIVSLVLLIYGFLWLVLSGGIIWYGFLIIPLLLMSINLLIKKATSQALTMYKRLAIGTMIFWGTCAYVSRISNIYSIGGYNIEHVGKSILDGNVFKYSTGLFSAEETVNAAYRNLNNALDQINESNDLVYQVGTSLSFEIRNNPWRVYKDDGLNVYYALIDVIKEKANDRERIIEVYKRSNIKYIIVDLNTHTIDKTPEQTLRKKFTLFLNTLINNPKVRLMATDRLYQFVDANGETHIVASVFPPGGQRNPPVESGSYAIYEIL